MNNIPKRRSITPPARVNCNIIKNIEQHLAHGEFPMYNIHGNKNTPPAPPRDPMETRVCIGCNQVWIIVKNTSTRFACHYCKPDCNPNCKPDCKNN